MKFLADENFDNNIIRGVLRRNPKVDIVRVQDVGFSAVDDPKILEWAAREKRVLLTHDVKTMRKYAYERLEQGLPVPGIVLVKASTGIGQVIEDILLIVECTSEDEWEGQVEYLPL